jgi:ATP-dependent Clp protease ATP-binding subunit ClpA
MMFERFTKDVRNVVTGAADEAAALGARQVEAEHLLLALASRGAGDLDRETVLNALEDEERASLAAVGLDVDVFEVGRPPTATARRLRFGASARNALEDALRVSVARRDRRITVDHLLVALAQPRRRRVRRVLDAAGIDPSELVLRASRST